MEPIITYGCAVWASLLRMKTGIKKIRSFQRTITLLLTRSFKSASTESLLVLSNLLPLDICIIELAAQRYLSTFGELFSPALLKTIQSFLPNILSIPSDSKSYQQHLNSHPPWTFSFDIISVFGQSNISLAPVNSTLFASSLVFHTRAAMRVWGCIIQYVWCKKHY